MRWKRKWSCVASAQAFAFLVKAAQEGIVLGRFKLHLGTETRSKRHWQSEVYPTPIGPSTQYEQIAQRD
jgi:hypothetical protein